MTQRLNRILTLSKVLAESLKIINSLLFRKDTKLSQLLVQRVLGQSGLNDIGTVKVVHTVRPHRPELHLARRGLVGVNVQVPVRELASIRDVDVRDAVPSQQLTLAFPNRLATCLSTN